MFRTIEQNITNPEKIPKCEEILYYFRNKHPNKEIVLQQFINRPDCHLICIDYLYTSINLCNSSFFSNILIEYIISNWNSLDLQTQKKFINEITRAYLYIQVSCSFTDENAISMHQLYATLVILCLPNKFPRGFEYMLEYNEEYVITHHHALQCIHYFFKLIKSNDLPSIITEEVKKQAFTYAQENANRINLLIEKTFQSKERKTLEAVYNAVAVVSLLNGIIEFPGFADFEKMIFLDTKFNFLNNIEYIHCIIYYMAVAFNNLPINEEIFNFFMKYFNLVYENRQNTDLIKGKSQEIIEFLSSFLIDHFHFFDSEEYKEILEHTVEILDAIWDINDNECMQHCIIWWNHLFEKRLELISKNIQFNAYDNVYAPYIHIYLSKLFANIYPVHDFSNDFPKRKPLLDLIERTFELVHQVAGDLLIGQINDTLVSLELGYEKSTYITLIYSLKFISQHILNENKYVDLLEESNQLIMDKISKKNTNSSILAEKLYFYVSLYDSLAPILINYQESNNYFAQSLKIQNPRLQESALSVFSHVSQFPFSTKLYELIIPNFFNYYDNLCNKDLKFSFVSTVISILVKSNDETSFHAIYHDIIEQINNLSFDSPANCSKLLEIIECLDDFIASAGNALNSPQKIDIDLLSQICLRSFEMIQSNPFLTSMINYMTSIQRLIFNIFQNLVEYGYFEAICTRTPEFLSQTLSLEPNNRVPNIIELIAKLQFFDNKNQTQLAQNISSLLYSNLINNSWPFTDEIKLYFTKLLYSIFGFNVELVQDDFKNTCGFLISNCFVNGPIQLPAILALTSLIEQTSLIPMYSVDLLTRLFSYLFRNNNHIYFTQFCLLISTILKRGSKEIAIKESNIAIQNVLLLSNDFSENVSMFVEKLDNQEQFEVAVSSVLSNLPLFIESIYVDPTQ